MGLHNLNETLVLWPSKSNNNIPQGRSRPDWWVSYSKDWAARYGQAKARPPKAQTMLAWSVAPSWTNHVSPTSYSNLNRNKQPTTQNTRVVLKNFFDLFSSKTTPTNFASSHQTRGEPSTDNVTDFREKSSQLFALSLWNLFTLFGSSRKRQKQFEKKNSLLI